MKIFLVDFCKHSLYNEYVKKKKGRTQMTKYNTYVEDEIASQIALISNIDSDELDVEDLLLICAED